MSKKAYILIFNIDIGNLPHSDVVAYMEDCKGILGKEQEYKDLLKANVLLYYIPVRNSNTTLEIIEFFIGSDKPHVRTGFTIGNADLASAGEQIINFLKEAKDNE